jgi:hypothetical protein
MSPRGEIAIPRDANKSPEGRAVNLAGPNDEKKSSATSWIEWNEIERASSKQQARELVSLSPGERPVVFTQPRPKADVGRLQLKFGSDYLSSLGCTHL